MQRPGGGSRTPFLLIPNQVDSRFPTPRREPEPLVQQRCLPLALLALRNARNQRGTTYMNRNRRFCS